VKHSAFFLLLLTAIEPLSAQPVARGRLQVTAHIEGSIAVVFTADSNVRKVAYGSGSASFIVPVFGGSFSQGSSSVAVGDTSFLISSPFGIKVLKANLASASYTLKATLGTPDRSHVWKIDAVDISAGSEQMIAPAEFYDTTNPHALVVSGPASEPTQSLANEIRFLVVVN